MHGDRFGGVASSQIQGLGRQGRRRKTRVLASVKVTEIGCVRAEAFYFDWVVFCRRRDWHCNEL
jgi:hypothetical protein